MLLYDGSMRQRFSPLHLPTLALAISSGLLLAVLPWLVITLGFDSDFMAFYTGGFVVLRGQLENLYDPILFQQWQQVWIPALDDPHRFVYIPVYAGVYLPFAGVPLAVSRLGMVLLSGVALLASVRISRRWQTLPASRMLLGLLALPALYFPFLVGQNSFVTLALFAAITAFMRMNRRPWLTGVCGGLLLYKPQLVIALIVVWAVQRMWRSLIAFGITGLITLLASWVLAPTATLQFFGVGQSLLSTVTTVGANVSFYAALANYMPLSVAQIGATVVTGVVIVALARTWWRVETPTAYHYGLLWLAPLLITPYLAAYDLVLFLLPLSLLLPALRSDRTLQILVVLWWYSPIVNLVAGEVIVLSAWATLALFLFCWRRTVTHSAPSPALYPLGQP